MRKMYFYSCKIFYLFIHSLLLKIISLVLLLLNILTIDKIRSCQYSLFLKDKIRIYENQLGVVFIGFGKRGFGLKFFEFSFSSNFYEKTEFQRIYISRVNCEKLCLLFT